MLGVQRVRCYPFSFDKFHGANPQQYVGLVPPELGWLRLAEGEHLHDNAVESESSLSATQSPSPPLPPPLPPPMPPPRAVRRLTVEKQQHD